jgi:TRAP-type C4-dicarboxylate transport system permease small subunit
MDTRASGDLLSELLRIEKLRRMRAWVAAAALIVFLIAIGSLGAGTTNPKWWSNAYVWLGAMGELAWLGLPLLGASIVLLVLALMLTLVIAKCERGMGSNCSSSGREGA